MCTAVRVRKRLDKGKRETLNKKLTREVCRRTKIESLLVISNLSVASNLLHFQFVVLVGFVDERRNICSGVLLRVRGRINAELVFCGNCRLFLPLLIAVHLSVYSLTTQEFLTQGKNAYDCSHAAFTAFIAKLFFVRCKRPSLVCSSPAFAYRSFDRLDGVECHSRAVVA